MSAVEGITRPIEAFDLESDPIFKRMVTAWEQGGSDSLLDLTSGPYSDLADSLIIVRDDGDGLFTYVHYGDEVTRNSGASMLGKSTEDFDSSVGRFFAQTYTQVLVAGRPFVTVNKSKVRHQTHSWKRILLPVRVEETQSRFVVVTAAAISLVSDVLTSVAECTGTLGGTLEPVYSDGEVTDFFLLPLVGAQVLLGEYSNARVLSDLLDRALTVGDIDQILERGPSSLRFQCEIGRSQERFGRRFMLRISGDDSQLIFSLVDATDLLEASEKADYERQTMSDFAESASDWLWETDEEHRYSYFSPSVENLTGKPAEYFLGLRRWEFGSNVENKAVMEENRKVVEAHQPFRDVSYKALVGGRWQWLCVSGKPRFDANGNFLGYRGTGANITEEIEAKLALEQQRTAMADFAASASDWMWESDADHILTFVSSAAERLTGRAPADYVGKSRTQLFQQDLHSDMLDEHLADLEARRPFSDFIYNVQRPDGAVFWASSNGKPVFHENGTFLGYRGTGKNITAEVEARQQAARRSEELAEAHRLGRMGGWSFDRFTRTVALSPELRELLNLSEDMAYVPLRLFLMKLDPGVLNKVRAFYRQMINHETAGEIDMVWTGGTSDRMELHILSKARHAANGALEEVFGTVQDITERKLAERELETLAFHDPLTGLGNRASFARKLASLLKNVLKQGGSCGLFLLDLDQFKEVNDSLGHAAGDEVLQHVAERLCSAMGPQGQVFRLGGDEFAILIPQAKATAHLWNLADAVIQAFIDNLSLTDCSVHISTSIGMVLLPDQSSNADEAMRFADLALYDAKESGRNRAKLFDAQMDETVQDRVSLARDLRHAITAEQIEAHFQLQVDVTRRQITGFEGLARWYHPERGYIPPNKFIPIAESSRLIADIGCVMLEQVCRQGREWLDFGGVPIEMAVNLSVAQLRHGDVEAEVRHALEKTGFPPKLLCLELTESVFSQDALPHIRRLFARLKALGVTIALDDFGTGYSSLQYLNTLPVDKLKIDRSFVRGCEDSQEQRRLLQGVFGLARGLDLTIIVEGVENAAELEIVSELGCDVVQGFHFGRPAPFYEACLNAVSAEADFGLKPLLWKSKPSISDTGHFSDEIAAKLRATKAVD
ncbi:MAG: EAL domain-containing protein [Pseudomonadota bacterium]